MSLINTNDNKMLVLRSGSRTDEGPASPVGLSALCAEWTAFVRVLETLPNPRAGGKPPESESESVQLTSPAQTPPAQTSPAQQLPTQQLSAPAVLKNLPKLEKRFELLREATETLIRSKRAQLTGLQNEIVRVKAALVTRTTELAALGAGEKDRARNVRQTTLALLRERDAARERTQMLEQHLALYREEASLPSLRSKKHMHFLERLETRFGLKLNFADLMSLEREAAQRPALHFTRRGTPVKALQIHGQWVYALVTPDETGVTTLTTAYTSEMLEEKDFFTTRQTPAKR